MISFNMSLSPSMIFMKNFEILNIHLEIDLNEDTMIYGSFTAGYKPGGTNLTYGFEGDNAPAMVYETFEPETVDSMEFGIKSDHGDHSLSSVQIPFLLKKI